ncbi:MAG: hypothetical protein ACR2J9_09505 [Gaiellales bacterium]
MQETGPNRKALRSALVGLLAAALVIGVVAFGGSLVSALRGDGLQASQSARSAFAVPRPATTTTLKAPRIARTPSTSTTQITYRVVQLSSVDGESQED